MGSSAAQKTEMTYTEFKTALNAGLIRTATVGIDQVSGALADGKATYHIVRVEHPELLKEPDTNKVNTSGQVTGDGGVRGWLMRLLPLAPLGGFRFLILRSMRGSTGAPEAPFPSVKARRARPVRARRIHPFHPER
jgi:ATP-dependent Zn protease